RWWRRSYDARGEGVVMVKRGPGGRGAAPPTPPPPPTTAPRHRRTARAAHTPRGSAPNTRGGEGGKTPKLAIGVNADADTVDPQAFKTIPGYYMLANLYDQLIDLKAVTGKQGLVADGTQTGA